MKDWHFVDRREVRPEHGLFQFMTGIVIGIGIALLLVAFI